MDSLNHLKGFFKFYLNREYSFNNKGFVFTFYLQPKKYFLVLFGYLGSF